MKIIAGVFVLTVLFAVCCANPAKPYWLKNGLKHFGKIPVPHLPVKPATMPPSMKWRLEQLAEQGANPLKDFSSAPVTPYKMPPPALKNALEGKEIKSNSNSGVLPTLNFEKGAEHTADSISVEKLKSSQGVFEDLKVDTNWIPITDKMEALKVKEKLTGDKVWSGTYNGKTWHAT